VARGRHVADATEDRSWLLRSTRVVNYDPIRGKGNKCDGVQTRGQEVVVHEYVGKNMKKVVVISVT
jgi:hypothetical protein